LSKIEEIPQREEKKSARKGIYGVLLSVGEFDIFAFKDENALEADGLVLPSVSFALLTNEILTWYGD